MPIFRVHSPAGRLRVTLPEDASLKQLYRDVAEVCGGVSPTQIVLYREANYRKHVKATSQISVSQPEAELEHGQVLYVKFSNEEDAKLAHDAMGEKAKKHVERPLLPAKADTPSPIGSASSNLGGACEGSTVDAPKFVAFDEFLKTRLGFDIGSLPLSLDFTPRQLVRGRPNVVPPTATLKHQPYRHVDHIEFVNVAEIRRFVDYWTGDLGQQIQRAGWLFGYYREDSHYPSGVRAAVEAVYEPPQECVDAGRCPVLLPDTDFDNVKTIAATMGLEIVGWVFTHPNRDVLLSPEEIVRIAALQLEYSTTRHYTGYRVSPFVTVTVSPDKEPNGGAPTTNAFMISDLAMALMRDGLLAKDQACEGAAAADGPPAVKLRLRPAVQNELCPDLLEKGQSVTEFDPDWMVVRVNDTAPVNPRSSLFARSVFPIENRLIEPQLSDLSRYLRIHSDKTAAATFADWHLLLFIYRVFDAATAVEVARHVADQTPVDPSFADTLQTLG